MLLRAGDQAASLSVLNSVIGPADLLSGNFDLTGGGQGFALSGLGSFADLMAGAALGGLNVRFRDDAEGAFLATLVLHATGSNASGFSGRLDDTTLVLRGNISVAAVPELETYMPMLAGLLVIARVAHARRQRGGSPRVRAA